MRIAYAVAAGACAALVTLAAVAGEHSVDEPVSQREVVAFADGVISDAMAAEHIAGVTIAIVKDGAPLVLKGYGIARLDPVVSVDPARTLFRVGSLSKTFTWIALMHEVERGRVQLDAPVNRYLPADLHIPDEGFAQPVRIIDLMRHSEGFEDSELGHLIVDTADRVESLSQYLHEHRPRRVRAPGVLSSYSNYGAVLAGYLVARLNGIEYETLIEREIIGPLQLQNTTFREPRAARAGLPAPMSVDMQAHLSSGFDWSGADFATEDTEYLGQIAPAGAASMTAADAARYMLMQFNDGELDGARIYDPRTAQAFRTSTRETPYGVNGWPHGFATTVLPGGFVGYGHSGATQIFFTNLIVVPDLRLGVFIAANTTTAWSLTQRFPKLLVEKFYAGRAASPHRPPDPRLAQEPSAYAGAYLTTRRPYAGLEKFIELFGGLAHVNVSSDGYLLTDYGPFSKAWVPDGPAGRFRSAVGDEWLNFHLDPTDRATDFLLPSGNATLQRVGLLYTRTPLDILTTLTLIIAAGICIRAALGGRSRVSTVSRVGLLAVSCAWLLAFIVFVIWLPQSEDLRLMYDFPAWQLIVASALALFATAGSIALLALLPWSWQGESTWTKLLDATALLVFVTFGSLIALWGGLLPWV